ncbi:MAG: CCA tRNA nucleotidyltransferase, partial [Thermoplasmata archaeon]
MKTVLRRIRPGIREEKKLARAVEALMNRLREAASREGLEPMLVGSVAKGTYLKNPDIDVFIMFPVDVPVKEMEQRCTAIGRSVVESWEMRHAQHPYVRGRFMGYDVEIVPCYRVDSPKNKKSPVDRTPFHTRYIQEHLRPELRDEVRLLKQFMKGTGVYGAEVRVKGFSGYLCELLVLKYGSFQGVLRASRRWKRGKSLCLEGGAHKSFNDPLVFIDPVDPDRNVAAPVSEQSLAVFRYAASCYLRKPSTRFFFPRDAEVPG